MGGRYGASDDGSSDYQDRRPDDADRSADQQTIADAVRAAADKHQQTNTGTGGTGGTSTTGSGSSEDRTDDSEGVREDTGSPSGTSDRQHPLIAIRASSGRTSSGTTLHDVDSAIAEYVADQLTDTVEWAVEETDPDDTEEAE